MTTGEVLALYDAQMRADPPPAEGVTHERLGALVRATGAWNLVQSIGLRDEDAAAAVAEQAAFARANGLALEWKLYDHDGPPSLRPLLREAGFVPDESETFLALDLRRTVGVADDGGTSGGAGTVEVRRVVDARGVEDYIAVRNAAFGERDRWSVQTELRVLGDPAVALFVAYADGVPASAGRLRLPPGRPFASMWGGGTVPHLRARGIYRALVAARAGEARRRGYRYLTVDARESSRPILERLGFVRLTGVTGWVLHGRR